MEYKKYEYPSFNLYTIKTNSFKSVQMEIMFRKDINKKDIMVKTFLADIMTDCSSKYSSRKMVVRKLEELYQANFYGITNKLGSTLMTSFVLSFLNPKYVNDDNYLEEVVSLPCEMILNPFITSEEFDIKNFNIVKTRLRDEILSVEEDINRVAIKKAFSYFDENSPSSYSIMGSIEELEEITPKVLYEGYQDLIENNSCDIFVAGDLDMDMLANIIFKHFKNPVIKRKEAKLYVHNVTPKKLRKEKSKGKFLEANLIHIYNLEGLDEKEKMTTFHFYNYLLGGGGLNTKLYQLLREKNSLCYGIKSIYLKYDNLLLIQTSLDNKDINKANKLIKQAFKEMNKGDFSDEDIAAAKESFIFSLNLALDDLGGIINNYVFHILDGMPLIEERIKLIKEITRSDILKISSKIKPNLQFVLEGENE